MDHLCYFCLVFVMFRARLFINALWSPAGKGLTSWLSFVVSNCVVVTFPLVNCPQGFWGSGENGSESWGALVIILRDLGSKLIILGI